MELPCLLEGGQSLTQRQLPAQEGHRAAKRSEMRPLLCRQAPHPGRVAFSLPSPVTPSGKQRDTDPTAFCQLRDDMARGAARDVRHHLLFPPMTLLNSTGKEPRLIQLTDAFFLLC